MIALKNIPVNVPSAMLIKGCASILNGAEPGARVHGYQTNNHTKS